MRRFIPLLLAVLLPLTASLSACRGDTAESGTESEVSEPSEVSEKPDDSPYTLEEVTEAAERLIARDIELCRIFAGGALADYAGDGSAEKGYTLVSGSDYDEYADIEALVYSVYSSEKTAARMLSYPDYGPDAVVSDGGRTAFRYVYVSDFAASLSSAEVSVVSYSDESAAVSVSVSGVNFELTMSAGDGWKLDDSLYFAYIDSDIAAQTEVGWENSVYLGTLQNSGSAPSMTGKMLVLNVFIEDTYSDWEDSDRKAVEQAVEDACSWLEKRSLSYSDTVLVIDTQTLYYTYFDSVSQSYDLSWLDVMFSKTIYSDVNGYIEQNTPDGYNSVCVFFHACKRGTDYVIPCDTSSTDYLTYYGERAMFFSASSGGQYASEYVTALLRICGAEELYKRGDADDIRTLFPDAIMLAGDSRSLTLSDYTVSPLTAFLIGWSTYIDPQLAAYTG